MFLRDMPVPRDPSVSRAPEQTYRLAADTFDDDEIAAARAVLDSRRLTMGPEVEAFERELAAWMGVGHALMVNSGSSANLIAVDAMLRRSTGPAPWRAGDEVLVPALAWPTTVWPLAQLGLVPVLVDVDRATLAIDLESARAALSPRTKGMFLIHVLGRAPDMGDYAAFCQRHDLALLEDTCESMGAHHGGRHAGRFGVMGTFSCYFSHHISTIEGGVVITDDARLRDDLASLRAHGWVRDRSDKAEWRARHPSIDERFLFVTGGYNVRPTDLQAAIGRVQLRKLDAMLAARERLAADVQALLSRHVPWLELVGAECLPGAAAPAPSRRERRHSWMTLPLRLRADAPVGVAAVKAHLESMGVETRPIIAGNLARHPAARSFPIRCADSLAACDDLLARGFMIGCHPVLSAGSRHTLEAALASLGALS
jgi:CDP-6-deoxy-D-xylo-4-hexulose-3-dehydrase